MISRDEFFRDWHSFGSRLYHYEKGRWVPTTEERFSVELERFNRRFKMKYDTKKWTLRILFFLLGFASGSFVIALWKGAIG